MKKSMAKQRYSSEFNNSKVTGRLDQVVQTTLTEIHQIAGPDSSVRVSIEPKSKDKELFHIRAVAYVLGQKLVVQKTGRKALSTLKSVRKKIIKQIRSHRNQVKDRRRRFAPRQWQPIS